MDPRTASRQGIEIWKPIAGYEGQYEVSNLGRVKSCLREIRNSRGTRVIQSKIMKLTPPHGNGKVWGAYANVCLTALDGTKTRYAVHMLVMRAFDGPRGELETRHLNDDKTDNTLHNLLYGTHKENMRDQQINGLYRPDRIKRLFR